MAQFKLTGDQVAAEVAKLRGTVEKKESLIDDAEDNDPIMADIESHKKSLTSVEKKASKQMIIAPRDASWRRTTCEHAMIP
jgi:hypothetical protein